MSEVKKSRMKPRLGQLMSQKGGMYVAEALKRADATLETLREPSLSGIDDYITALDNLLTSGLRSTTPCGSRSSMPGPATSSASAAPSATRPSSWPPARCATCWTKPDELTPTVLAGDQGSTSRRSSSYTALTPTIPRTKRDPAGPCQSCWKSSGARRKGAERG
jgi:hypothetical protein